MLTNRSAIRLALTGLAGALATAGCSNTPFAALDSVSRAATAIAAVQAPIQVISDHPGALVEVAKADLTGKVAGPAGVLPNNGGQVIGQGGALLQLLAVAETPLADAAVYLVGADGKALPNSPKARTDANGAFKLVGVPAKATLLIQVDVLSKAGKPAALQAFGWAGTEAALNLPATCLTVAVLRDAKTLPTLDAKAWDRGVNLTAEQLFPGQWPELSDRAAIAAKMDELAAASPGLAAALKALR